jgi:predicted nucleic acid-binding protein
VTYALDACALIALLNGEEGDEKVDALFQKAQTGECSLVMSVINLIEVFYGYIRDKGMQAAFTILEPLNTTPLRLISAISPRVYHEAARIKGTYSCSLADAVGIATAVELSAQFVTSDHKELEAVEAGEGLSFLWLPPRPQK